jgi:hypothetical protein
MANKDRPIVPALIGKNAIRRFVLMRLLDGFDEHFGQRSLVDRQQIERFPQLLFERIPPQTACPRRLLQKKLQRGKGIAFRYHTELFAPGVPNAIASAIRAAVALARL